MYQKVHKRTEITEERTEIGFDTKPNEEIEIHNIIQRHDGIEMRSSADGGSYISFPQANPHDEWAFELSFTNPTLHYPESAGIYLWYTEGTPEKGGFKGLNGHFQGMMAGLELMGRYVELTLGANDGELDAAEYEDVLLMKDALDPVRFSSAKGFTLKIISTEKNFKLEIYDTTGKLLYDNLRYLKAAALGDLRKGKHFSITTSYEKVPTYKSFLLHNARLFSRKEGLEYDPLEIKSRRPDNEPRLFDNVSHYNIHVQHLVSNLEHFVRYIRKTIGEPIGLSLIKGVTNFTESIDAYDEALEDVVNDVEATAEPPTVIEEIRSKVEMTAANVALLEETVSKLHSLVSEIENRTEATIMNGLTISCACVGIMVILYLGKIFLLRFTPKKDVTVK